MAEAFATDRALMPWHPSWQLPVCTLGIWAAGLLMVALVVGTSRSAKQHFGAFYRGDISAFLAERWQVSVSLLPIISVLLFFCCWFRHPLVSPTGGVELWNYLAMACGLGASVGLAGVGIVTQKDNMNTSTYPLQSDQLHSECMWFGFPCLFIYECLHTGAVVHDVAYGVIGGRLAIVLAVAELALCIATVLHFVLWIVETAKEEYPDDERCDKRNEWFCVLCIGCYWLTLPILTECVEGGDLAHTLGCWGAGCICAATLCLLGCSFWPRRGSPGALAKPDDWEAGTCEITEPAGPGGYGYL